MTQLRYYNYVFYARRGIIYCPVLLTCNCCYQHRSNTNSVAAALGHQWRCRGGQTDHRGARRIALGYRTIRKGELRADLTFLTSDPLQGRMSLENGDAVAIEWVASELKKAGLKPAFGDSYVQPVPIVEYRADAAQSSIVIRHGGGEQKFAWVDISGGFKRSVDVTAPVVFAGFGVSAPELGYDDYAGE